MTKEDLVKEIAKQTGISKAKVFKTVEALMEIIQVSMVKKQDIYLRGFGSFLIKKRAMKKARNISKKTTMILPEHFTPTFKPAKGFAAQIKKKKVI